MTAESIEKRFPTKKSLVRTNIKAQEEGKGVEFSDPNQYGETT